MEIEKVQNHYHTKANIPTIYKKRSMNTVKIKNNEQIINNQKKKQ